MTFSLCKKCGKRWERNTQSDHDKWLKDLVSECDCTKSGRDIFGFAMTFKTIHNCGGEITYNQEEITIKNR